MSLPRVAPPERDSKLPDPVPEGLMVTAPSNCSGLPDSVPLPLAVNVPLIWSKVPLLVKLPAVWVNDDLASQFNASVLPAAILTVPLLVQFDMPGGFRESLPVSALICNVPWLSSMPLICSPPTISETIVPALVSFAPDSTVNVAYVPSSADPRRRVPRLVRSAATFRLPKWPLARPATRSV